MILLFWFILYCQLLSTLSGKSAVSVNFVEWGHSTCCVLFWWVINKGCVWCCRKEEKYHVVFTENGLGFYTGSASSAIDFHCQVRIRNIAVFSISNYTVVFQKVQPMIGLGTFYLPVSVCKRFFPIVKIERLLLTRHLLLVFESWEGHRFWWYFSRVCCFTLSKLLSVIWLHWRKLQTQPRHIMLGQSEIPR